jgi:hypothetical protein
MVDAADVYRSSLITMILLKRAWLPAIAVCKVIGPDLPAKVRPIGPKTPFAGRRRQRNRPIISEQNLLLHI